MKELVIATQNEGKAKEFRQLLSAYDFEVKTLNDLDEIPTIEEDGQTFEENALIKARTIANHLNIPVIADDSGLTVDFLNGEPGIHSARYAGVHGDDEANNKKLLEALDGVDIIDRSAKFVCVIAFVDENKEEKIIRGEVEGVIAEEPKGDGGFGYDPLFYLPMINKTFGQLQNEKKSVLSHRGEAIRKFKDHLISMI